jgi:hypothetical protein
METLSITWEDAFNSEKVLAPDRYALYATRPVVPGPDGKYPHPMHGRTGVL